MSESHEFGKQAEEFICQKYIQNGYEILEHNWRLFPAEIDIIAKKGSTLAIVEVKARANEYFQLGEKSVNRKKRKLLVKAADEYIQINQLDLECRYDIAVVTKRGKKLVAKIFIDAFLAHEL